MRSTFYLCFLTFLGSKTIKNRHILSSASVSQERGPEHSIYLVRERKMKKIHSYYGGIDQTLFDKHILSMGAPGQVLFSKKTKNDFLPDYILTILWLRYGCARSSRVWPHTSTNQGCTDEKTPLTASAYLLHTLNTRGEQKEAPSYIRLHLKHTQSLAKRAKLVGCLWAAHYCVLGSWCFHHTDNCRRRSGGPQHR